MADFSVDAVCDDTASVVTVTGDLDLATAGHLAAVGLLTLSCLHGHGEGLIVDLTDVSFIDSTGLSALVKIRNAALDDGRTVALKGPNPHVKRVLEITGLATAFGLRP